MFGNRYFVFIIAFIGIAFFQGCINRTAKYDEYPLEPESKTKSEESSTGTDGGYNPINYPCSLLTYIDSLYCANDTALLKSILDTAMFIDNNHVYAKDSAGNYPFPFSIPELPGFLVEHDSDKVTYFVTNETKSSAIIRLNATLPKGYYGLFCNYNDNCQKPFCWGTFFADIKIGDKRTLTKFTILK